MQDSRDKIKEPKYIFFLILALLPISIFGIYLIMLDQRPSFSETEVDALLDKYYHTVSESNNSAIEDRLIIPKMGVNIEINQGGPEVLEDGIWHRSAGVGDPINGGNFVLSGHRFTMGLSDSGLWNSSPLFNIDRLEKGDEIIIIWEGKKFSYVVDKLFEVAPTQIEIEAQTEDPLMTLYTCTLGGATDGRYVVRATPTKELE